MVELAQILERGRFNAIFFADVIGAYDSYRGNREASVRNAVQFPVNDPSALIPALALVTENLGFAFTLSILQEHPFSFARRASTLDHLTGGWVAWNIVTSYLESAAPTSALTRCRCTTTATSAVPSTWRCSTSCGRVAGRTML